LDNRVEKHEIGDAVKWDKTATILERIDTRLDKAEAEIAKHDIAVQLHLKKD
jgi:hypothetical protein